MLNIVTVSFNYEYLEGLYSSIPKIPGVNWYVVTNSKREIPIFLHEDCNVPLDLDEDVKNGPARINKVFELIKGYDPNGHFQIVDEDTEFHPNAYNIWKENRHFEGLIVGQQDYYNNLLRLKAHIPCSGYIDTGMCICHNSALNHVKWPEYGLSLSPDAVFFEEVYRFFGKERTKVLENEVISYYNYQKKDCE